MLTLNDIVIDIKASFGTKEDWLISNVTKSYLYENNKKTDKLSHYSVEIVLPKKHFEKFTVKLPVDSQLKQFSDNFEIITCENYEVEEFVNLSIKPMYINNTFRLIGAADEIKLKKIQGK